MKCPICGTVLPLYTDRCPGCGCQISPPQPQTRPDPRSTPAAGGYYDPPNKSGLFGWCCCGSLLLVPLLMLLTVAVIFGIHTVVEQVSIEDFGSYGEAPFLPPAASAPSESVEGAFFIRRGEITFLPHKWAGGSVIEVPETVNGQTVTALAPRCFAGCTELTTIILPDTVTRIGQDAFSGCTELRGLLVPDGTNSIETDAFAGCTGLEALYIPATVTHIAPGCMDDCAGLLYIFYDGTFDAWNTLYSDFVNPFTTAICTDGPFFHGAKG